jgi:hypothetical protein
MTEVLVPVDRSDGNGIISVGDARHGALSVDALQRAALSTSNFETTPMPVFPMSRALENGSQGRSPAARQGIGLGLPHSKEVRHAAFLRL